MADLSQKTCYLICPIGEPNSDTRRWSDDIYFNLVLPVAKEFDYLARRAIDEPRPGEITPQIILDITQSELVVADLTFHNANVFYELAIRHAHGLPFIHIAEAGTRIPFDISNLSTVFIDRTSFAAMDITRSDLRKHFEAIQNDSASFDNPIKRLQDKINVTQSTDPIEKQIAVLRDEIAEIRRDRETSSVFSKIGALPYSSGERFGGINEQVLALREAIIANFILEHKFDLVFDPLRGRKKLITFLPDGTVGEGRNQNEHNWRISRGRLELLEDNGSVHSRFVYDSNNKSLIHTNEPGLPSIVGQSIIPSN